jgi:hypothetical protein
VITNKGKEMPKKKNIDPLQGQPKRGYQMKEPRDPEREELYEIIAQLTPFEQKFVEAYPKAESAAEAARLAGSMAKRPEQVANNTLRNPKVMRAVALMRAKRIDAAALDEIEVVTKFREVFTTALDNGDYKEANRAAELLGAHLGMFRGHGKSARNSPMFGLTDEGARLQREAEQGGLSEALRNPNLRNDLAAMAEIIVRTQNRVAMKEIDNQETKMLPSKEVVDLEEIPST